MNKNYEVGDVITYRTFANELRTITVIEKTKDVKNHQPGFSGKLVLPEGRMMPAGSFCWGYDYQMRSVPERFQHITKNYDEYLDLRAEYGKPEYPEYQSNEPHMVECPRSGQYPECAGCFHEGEHEAAGFCKCSDLDYCKAGACEEVD